MSGSAHVVYKQDSLSSNPKTPEGGEAPFDFNQLQTGFTLGGPLVRDRMFYFTALDFQDASSTKQIDATRIEPAVVAAFAALGSPNENGSIDRTNDARVFLAKGDWSATAANLLTLRYNYTYSEQKNGTFDVDSWGRSANATEKDSSHAVTGSAISTLRSTVLNEFRFQYAKENRPRPYDGPIITDGNGLKRPLPDTAFDFGSTYRFGMPFFIPVEYYDTRTQFNDNISYLRGPHAFKLGAEYNRVNSVQTFLGFANGRYIFDSTAGFLEDLQNHTNNHVLLYLQQAGVGSISVEEAGTQSIPQTEPAVFLQDSWQATPNLNVQYGLRWEAQIEPDPITDPDDVFFAPFIGTTKVGQEFPSNGKIPSDKSMWQPRLGMAWNPNGDGRKVLRASAGIFYGRIPGLALASSRSTNGSRGQTIFRSSAVNFDGCLPVYPNKLSPSCVGAPDHPDVFVFDRDFQNPRTLSASLSWEQELIPEYAFLVKYNYAKGEHITRFRNANDALLGNAGPGCTFACGPWSTGLGPGGGNGIGALTVVESTAKSLYQGLTVGVTKRPSHNVQFQAYYTYSKDKSDDDNERDPFSFRYAKVTDLDAEYGYSDRDQRHRVNTWLLWNAPYGLDLNLRYSYRSAQPKPLSCVVSSAFCGKDAFGNERFMADAATPQDRINPDGSVTQRNLGRKDNEYSSLDFRLSKQFAIGNGLIVEPALDVFNLFNSANFRRPEVTNLVFNFDGTVQSGVGDPRQMQLALRVLW